MSRGQYGPAAAGTRAQRKFRVCCLILLDFREEFVELGDLSLVLTAAHVRNTGNERLIYELGMGQQSDGEYSVIMYKGRMTATSLGELSCNLGL